MATTDSTQPSSTPIPITIIGAGITGLATAYHIVTSHPSKYEITIIARDLPGDLGRGWSSPWAGAVFHPQATDNPDLQALQINSFKFYHSLAISTSSSETGVKIFPTSEYFDSASTTSSTPDPSNSWIHSLMPDFKVLDSSEISDENKNSGVTSAVSYTSLAINPNFFLPWLQAKLEASGVKFLRAQVESISHAETLTPSAHPRITINASGLGALTLAGDKSVHPVRGQTVFIKSSFDKLIMREGSEYTYVIPRPGSGGVIVGGVKHPNRTDDVVDEEVRSDILRRVGVLSGGAFDGVSLEEGEVVDVIGFRPGREAGLRVEREGNVIHAYGAGGAGYIYSFGVAKRVGELLEEILA